jgi:predicted secreted protein
VKGAKIFKAESFGTWKIVYQRGGEVGGVFDAGDAAKARKFVEQYLEGKIQ